jgi:hypothetical protein
VKKDKAIPLIKYHTTKMYMGIEVELHTFLTFVLDVAGIPSLFTTAKRAPVPIAQEAGWATKPVWPLRRNL